MLNSMNQNLWLMTLYSAQRGEPPKPIFFSLQPTQVPVTIIVCMYLYIYDYICAYSYTINATIPVVLSRPFLSFEGLSGTLILKGDVDVQIDIVRGPDMDMELGLSEIGYPKNPVGSSLISVSKLRVQQIGVSLGDKHNTN